MGEDCQVNPIAIGHRTNEPEESTGLVALTLEYFGPNGEPICDRKEIIYWNDQTQESDGYGRAIATAFKTPEAGEVASVKNILTLAQNLSDRLVLLKQQYQTELEQPETLGNINLTSEQKRLFQEERLIKGEQIECIPVWILSHLTSISVKFDNAIEEVDRITLADPKGNRFEVIQRRVSDRASLIINDIKVAYLKRKKFGSLGATWIIVDFQRAMD